jgi:hypothetical protein
MEWLNSKLNLERMGGIGFKNKTSPLNSFDECILLYVYFKDLYDLTAIRISTLEQQQLELEFFKFNVNLDFGNIDQEKPTLQMTCNESEQSMIKMPNVDYFTLKITSKISPELNISRIDFYGFKNKRNIRRLDKVKINWVQNMCNSIGNQVVTHNTTKSFL